MVVAWAIAALLAYLAATGLYVFTQAALGRAFGLAVREISVGFGPRLFRRTINGCDYKLGLIPYGGYTKFLTEDDRDRPLELPRGKRFDEAPAAVRAVVCGSGPVVNLVFGLMLLGLPVGAGGERLRVTTPEEANISPRAVPGLAVDPGPASWESQARLFRGTGLEYLIRIATIRSLAGWGGHFGAFVTCGALGAHSPWTWVSAVGAVILLNGVVNLLPIPALNGFLVVWNLAEAVLGKLPERLKFWLTMPGLLVVLLALGRTVWADITWAIAQFG